MAREYRIQFLLFQLSPSSITFTSYVLAVLNMYNIFFFLISFGYTKLFSREGGGTKNFLYLYTFVPVPSSYCVSFIV